MKRLKRLCSSLFDHTYCDYVCLEFVVSQTGYKQGKRGKESDITINKMKPLVYFMQTFFKILDIPW